MFTNASLARACGGAKWCALIILHVHKEFSLPAWFSFEGGYMSRTKQATSGHTVETQFSKIKVYCNMEDMCRWWTSVTVDAASCCIRSFCLICPQCPLLVEKQQKPDSCSSFQSLTLFTIPQLLVSMESLRMSSRCHISEPTREQQWVTATAALESHPALRAHCYSSCGPCRFTVSPPLACALLCCVTVRPWHCTRSIHSFLSPESAAYSLLYIIYCVSKERGNVVKMGGRQEHGEMS